MTAKNCAFLTSLILLVAPILGASPEADLILSNGKFEDSSINAIAMKDGRILAIGTDESIQSYYGQGTKKIDVNGRTVIPGLNDSHVHLIRGGLNYNMELRWDGVPSLKHALAMLKEQAERTPSGQWVRVVGGWSEYQFEERRLPTLKEINDATGDTPAFILYQYSLGFMNKAAIRELGYTQDTSYPAGEIEVDEDGKPTGLLIAKPSALILYSTLVKAPKLSKADKINSSLHYFRELNRLGITSSIDAGGGGQYYPNDYDAVKQLAREGKLTVRIAYYLFAQVKGQELADYKTWISQIAPYHNDDMFRPNGLMMHGAGENLTWSAADFENFREPRPELGHHMEGDLKPIIELLVRHRWPFRIHATYGESIERFLDVFETVDRETPFNNLRWIVDHAETVSDKSMERIKKLGGGIAIQNRMFFQGEQFVKRYGIAAAKEAPPIRRMLEMEIPIGLGTDGTRVSSYNPWLSLYWTVSGKTWGGLQLFNGRNRLSRSQALHLMTKGSAWFSSEERSKGALVPGEFADMIVLSNDYFTVPEEKIKTIESVLTIVDGRIVYGAEEFASLSPKMPPISPPWSPIRFSGGYYKDE
ncbi:MAG: amidohydrolase [Planctomycetota bacterium]|jgi:predicted amidohydrolase YtcJ